MMNRTWYEGFSQTSSVLSVPVDTPAQAKDFVFCFYYMKTWTHHCLIINRSVYSKSVILCIDLLHLFKVRSAPKFSFWCGSSFFVNPIICSLDFDCLYLIKTIHFNLAINDTGFFAGLGSGEREPSYVPRLLPHIYVDSNEGVPDKMQDVRGLEDTPPEGYSSEPELTKDPPDKATEDGGEGNTENESDDNDAVSEEVSVNDDVVSSDIVDKEENIVQDNGDVHQAESNNQSDDDQDLDKSKDLNDEEKEENGDGEADKDDDQDDDAEAGEEEEEDDEKDKDSEKDDDDNDDEKDHSS